MLLQTTRVPVIVHPVVLKESALKKTLSLEVGTDTPGLP